MHIVLELKCIIFLSFFSGMHVVNILLPFAQLDNFDL